VNAAELITIAGARGIDLSRIGGNASNTNGAAATRPLTDLERRFGLEVTQTAKGRTTRTAVAAIWSHAELGMSAKGVPNLPWYAACYSYCGDRTAYWKLWFGLADHARKLAMRNNWRPLVLPSKAPDEKDRLLERALQLLSAEQRQRLQRHIDAVTERPPEPQFYLERLARLVLDEEALRAYFATAGVHAAYMAVDDVTWKRLLEPRFALLRARYEVWLGTARTMIQRWLGGRGVPE